MTVCSVGVRGWPPSIVRTLEPMPEILAPQALRKLHKSWTLGSEAALVIVVTPGSLVAKAMTFSVAVGLVSKRQTGPAAEREASMWMWLFLVVTLTPRSKKACKWVSKGRAPRQQPEGW